MMNEIELSDDQIYELVVEIAPHLKNHSNAEKIIRKALSLKNDVLPMGTLSDETIMEIEEETSISILSKRFNESFHKSIDRAIIRRCISLCVSKEEILDVYYTMVIQNIRRDESIENLLAIRKMAELFF